MQGRLLSDSFPPTATGSSTWLETSGSGAPTNTTSSRTTQPVQTEHQKILECRPHPTPEASVAALFCATPRTARAIDLRPGCLLPQTLPQTTWAFAVSVTIPPRKAVPRLAHERWLAGIVALNSDGLDGHQGASTHSRAWRVGLGFFPSLR